MPPNVSIQEEVLKINMLIIFSGDLKNGKIMVKKSGRIRLKKRLMKRINTTKSHF